MNALPIPRPRRRNNCNANAITRPGILVPLTQLTRVISYSSRFSSQVARSPTSRYFETSRERRRHLPRIKPPTSPRPVANEYLLSRQPRSLLPDTYVFRSEIPRVTRFDPVPTSTYFIRRPAGCSGSMRFMPPPALSFEKLASFKPAYNCFWVIVSIGRLLEGKITVSESRLR